MLNVTTEARTELQTMLMRALTEHQDSNPPDLGFRLLSSGSELSLVLDTPRDGDEVMTQDGRSMLILDAAASERMKDLTLDVVDTPEGKCLGLRQ